MPDNDTILSRAEDTYDLIQQAICAKVGQTPGGSWIAAIAGALGFVIVIVISTVASIVAWLVANIGATILDSLVKGLSDVRNNRSPAMNDLITDTMGEFFGQDFDSSNLSAAPGEDTNLANMQAIGSDILGMLEGEFAPDGTMSASQGLAAAQAFVGFATNFGVRSAFLGMLGELSSMGIIQDTREIGEGVARNLGLGRLVRRAIQPLVQILITTPLTWVLNNRYSPKRLNEAELYRARLSGTYSDADYYVAMGDLGYRDIDIKALEFQQGDKYSVAETFHAMRYGVIDHDTAIARLQFGGWTLDAATFALVAADAERADTWVKVYIEQAAKAYVAGQMDQSTFYAFLDAAPIGDIEREWIKLTYDQESKIPHRRLTLGQLESALEQNVMTVGEFEDYLTGLGFDADDSFVILQLTLLKQQKMEAAAAAKAKKTAKSTSTSSTSTGTSTTGKTGSTS
jgi:hypothetical protein